MPDAPFSSPDADEALSGEFDAQSWDAFENNDAIEERNQEIIEEREKLKEKFAQVFNNEHGKEVLNHLMEMTLKRSTFSPQYENPDRMGYFREGQNTIVAYIIQQVNEGITGEPNNPRKDL